MIEVKFKGYVNEVKTYDWGTVYNVSHNQVRKNHQGEWETVGRDYLSVTGPAGFAENDQVEVVGSLKTKTYEKRDGSKGIALQVRATSMSEVKRNSHVNATHQQTLNSVWPEVNEIPF